MVWVKERSCARALAKSALKRSSARLICLYVKSRTCRISDASWSVKVGDVGVDDDSAGEGLGGCRMGVGS